MEIERLKELWQLPISGITYSKNLQSKNSLSKDEIETTLDSELLEKGSHKILSKYLDEDILASIDPFEAVQLAYVIEVCIQNKNQAAAGRYLYASSRDKLKSPNDSDRLRKYLMKFDLRFDELN